MLILLAMSNGGSDEELLTRWHEQDRQAGASLVERHFASVERFFATKTNAQVAEDLVQTTFARCLEGASRWRQSGSFRAYLFGVARNVLLEHIRGRVRDARSDAELHESAIFDLGPGLHTQMAASAERRHLIAALQRLPVDLQSLLELHYWEELSMEELGQTFGVPAGTIKSRLHRARQLLKDALDSTPGPEDARETARRIVGGWLGPA